MSVVLSPWPIFRGFANDGTALVGGKLFTYIAGTTTPQATWVDSTQTTFNSNPVILNARGEANVWLNPSLTYKYVLQDAANNPIWTVDNISVATATAFYPQTPAEALAGVTPTFFNYPPGDVRRYGGILDGTTDCVAAMGQACIVGQPVTVPGNMALASASLAALPNKAITVASGTTIQGYAGFTCTITGLAACNVFWCINPLGIKFLPGGFTCLGNGANSATSTTGYFWYLQGTAAATAEFGDCGYDGLTLKNFAGLYWIYIDNVNATSFAFVRFRGINGNFISQPGNCQTAGLTNVTTTACIIGISGSDTITGFYTVKDIEIHDNVAQGTFIKEFVFFWSGVLRGKAYSNTCVSFGQDASISDNAGSYVFTAYDHSHGTGLQPNEIEIYDNTIDGVRDCGIYTASPNCITIHGNVIQSQTATTNTPLQAGAIVLHGCTDVTCTGNVIRTSQFGINIAQDPANKRCEVRNNTVSQMPINGVGVTLSGTTGGDAPNISIDGLSVSTPAGTTGCRGIHVVATSTLGIAILNIKNFVLENCANGIDLFAPDSTVPRLGTVTIGRGVISGATGNNIQWLNCTNTSSRTTFDSIDFTNMQPNAVGFYFQSCVNITIRNLTFYDMTSGATQCWYGSGAQGRAMGVQFVNVAIANRYSGLANELGVIAPAFTGADNDFIQDLNPTLLTQTITGSGGTDSYTYTRSGWVWDRVAVVWRESRGLIV